MIMYRATPDNPNTHIVVEPNRLHFAVQGTRYKAIKASAESIAEEFFQPGMYDTIEYTFSVVEQTGTDYASIGEKPIVYFECNVVAVFKKAPTISAADIAAGSITTEKLCYAPDVSIPDAKIKNPGADKIAEYNSGGNVYIYTGVGGPTTK